MLRKKRSFSTSEKLEIINEADQFGITVTLRKHNPISFGHLKVAR